MQPIRTLSLILLLFLILIPAKYASAVNSIPKSEGVQRQSAIPSSKRARLAMERVTPRLKQALAAQNLDFGAPVYIRIFKEEKRLEVWLKKDTRYHQFKDYEICTYGWKGLGPKLRQGDGKAPEGFYFVKPRQLNPISNYHLAFNLGYPNRYDRIHGRTGSALMVHGDCVSIGCYAMTDKNIEEIYTLVHAAFENGQPFFRVHIFPFRMTPEKMQKHRNSAWIRFWNNLRQGYVYFRQEGFVPPDVQVMNRRYVFRPGS